WTPVGASKWEVYTDEYRNIYFYNTVTGESVWELPLDEENDDKANISTADDARESDAQRESALGLSTRVDTTAAVKHKDDYSTYEIAIEVIDTVVTMLAKVEQNADTLANSATKQKKIKKKKFVSPAAEVRFKKNQANEEKRNKRIRERMKMSYMNILIPAIDSVIDKKIDASNNNHSTSGHLVSVQKPEHQDVGTLFTLDDSLRWRLEREVQQIKQRHAIRKERHCHKQQVLRLKAQQQMLKDFRTELTRYLLSKIECSPQLRQQRILLLSTPQQLAEMDSKRKKTMEPEILERYTNEQLMAKVNKMKNIQKVFVLIDEVGLGRLHLLQILFGIFTIEYKSLIIVQV
uniref:WW domain-containing protein n=1 Tax=Globisporangium ultimum (strain ATCC 200006 / CBS 805.95 / DAOM BR144) TaxID=431595 RepID=K3WLG5_GLOUD